MSRNETLFSIRYAVRVLERYARFWRRLDAFIKFFSLVAGSGAIAAIGAQNEVFSWVSGVFFASLQAIEFSARPSDGAALAAATGKGYSRLRAAADDFDDAGLEKAYRKLVADDEVIVPEAIRFIAYNDVVAENGSDPSYLYVLTRWQRFVGLLA